MDYGILQARILEWVVFPFSRGSSQPRDWTQVSHTAGRFFTSWATRTDYSLQQKPCTWNSMPWTLRWWWWWHKDAASSFVLQLIDFTRRYLHTYTTGNFINRRAWWLLTIHSMELITIKFFILVFMLRRLRKRRAGLALGSGRHRRAKKKERKRAGTLSGLYRESEPFLSDSFCFFISLKMFLHGAHPSSTVCCSFTDYILEGSML